MVQDRRNRLEIYHDILAAIIIEAQNSDKISPTRIQFKSNLSYDKLKKFLQDMERKNLLLHNSLEITEIGQKFFQDYADIREQINSMCENIFKED